LGYSERAVERQDCHSNTARPVGEAQLTSENFGYAKRNIQPDRDFIQIEIDLKTVNEKQTATVFSSDVELTPLGKSLILNWLRLKHGSDLPDGKCVMRNIRVR
jgi:hypothetical protein